MTYDNHSLFYKDKVMLIQRAVDTVEQTVITCLEVSSSKGVVTTHFIAFQHVKEFYEMQLSERGKKSNKAIRPNVFKASIPKDALGIFITAGSIKGSFVNETTEEPLVQCEKNRCVPKMNGEHIHLAHNAMEKVEIKIDKGNLENIACSLPKDYNLMLEIVIYKP